MVGTLPVANNPIPVSATSSGVVILENSADGDLWCYPDGFAGDGNVVGSLSDFGNGGGIGRVEFYAPLQGDGFIVALDPNKSSSPGTWSAIKHMRCDGTVKWTIETSGGQQAGPYVRGGRDFGMVTPDGGFVLRIASIGTMDIDGVSGTKFTYLARHDLETGERTWLHTWDGIDKYGDEILSVGADGSIWVVIDDQLTVLSAQGAVIAGAPLPPPHSSM